VAKTFILAWFAIAAPGVFAQSAPQKVGVIQIQSAMVSTKDGQKAVQELNVRLQPRKTALDHKAAEVRELGKCCDCLSCICEQRWYNCNGLLPDPRHRFVET